MDLILYNKCYGILRSSDADHAFSYIEGGCKYIEQDVANRQQVLFLHYGVAHGCN